MIEAIKHFKDLESFKSLNVKCKKRNYPNISECEDRDICLNEPHYKNFASLDSRPQLSNINSYTELVWKELIFAHLCKANYLVYDEFIFPSSLISQNEIFSKQQIKYINQSCPKVAVLSALPLYVLDYYGVKRTLEKLSVVKNII